MFDLTIIEKQSAIADLVGWAKLNQQNMLINLPTKTIPE